MTTDLEKAKAILHEFVRVGFACRTFTGSPGLLFRCRGCGASAIASSKGELVKKHEDHLSEVSQ